MTIGIAIAVDRFKSHQVLRNARRIFYMPLRRVQRGYLVVLVIASWEALVASQGELAQSQEV